MTLCSTLGCAGLASGVLQTFLKQIPPGTKQEWRKTRFEVDIIVSVGCHVSGPSLPASRGHFLCSTCRALTPRPCTPRQELTNRQT